MRIEGMTASLSARVSFWLLAALLVLLLCAATAPSPLYAVYQELMDFPAITLTVIYAVYALGALLASVTTGRLSDHVGRRRVLSLALIVQIAAMLVFVAASDVVLLLVGRFLNGLATGAALGAIGAGCWISSRRITQGSAPSSMAFAHSQG
jgi:MFS family permease